MNDSASVQTDSKTALVTLGSVGVTATDRDHLLRAQEELLSRTSSAADEVARHDLFFRYRAGKAHHTIRMQTAALTCFMTYLEGPACTSPRTWPTSRGCVGPS